MSEEKDEPLDLIRITSERVSDALRVLGEELNGNDFKKLEQLLALFNDDNEAVFADCLSILYPEKSDSAAQSDFRGFRSRLKKAGVATNTHIQLEVTSSKRLTASERRCWFLGVISRADKAAQFTSDMIRDRPKHIVDPSGVATTGSAQEKDQILVTCFVSYAEKDRVQAEKLLEILDEQFHVSLRFQFSTWKQDHILPGELTEEKIHEAYKSAFFGLLMVSPKYLAEMPDEVGLFLNDSKPLIPVVIEDVNQDLQNLRALKEVKLFTAEIAKKQRSFLDCEKPLQKIKFAHQLYCEIEKRLNDWFQKRDEAIEQIPKLAAEERFKGFIEGKGLPAKLDDSDIETLERSDFIKAAIPILGFLEAWALEKAGPLFAAVLGEYGIGKTTSLKEFAHLLIEKRRQDKVVPAPIYVDLRLYRKSKQLQVAPRVEELLDDIIKNAWYAAQDEPCVIKGRDIISLVREDNVILIFDGLDEQLVHLDESQGQALVRELWSVLPPIRFRQKGNPKAASKQRGKVIFSCRSHYFKSIRDQNQVLARGDDRDDISASDYRAIFLLPFNEEQIRAYLCKSLGHDRVESTMDLLASVHNLRELSQRPYLLNLITQQIGYLEQKRALGEMVYGINLYERTVEDWLGRDKGKHKFLPEDKEELMEDIAWAMWQDGARGWAWKKVQKWLQRRLAEDAVYAQQYLGDTQNLEPLMEDFRTATFVLRPENSADEFRFAHTSLQEYFLARSLYRSLEEGNYDAWKIPEPSPESLDFLGQLLAQTKGEKQRSDCLNTLSVIFAGDDQRATLNALRYWQQVLQLGYPCPQPKNINLQNADLRNWEFRGVQERPLVLSNVALQGANLSHSQWEHVRLISANLAGANALNSYFLNVELRHVDMQGMNAAGTRLERCRVVGLSNESTANWQGSHWVNIDGDTTKVEAVLNALGACCIANHPNHIYLPRLSRRLSSSLVFQNGHQNRVSACAYSPDGQSILSGSYDKTLKVWDAQTGQEICTLIGHQDPVRACAYSPNGQNILSASDDKTLKVWDAQTGQELCTLNGHQNWVSACAYSPDGQHILSGSYDKTLKVWDAQTGQELCTLRGHQGAVSSCAYSSDGQHILSGSYDKTLKVWHAQTGQEVCILNGHQNLISACVYSSDGKCILSASDDKTLKVWDAQTGQELCTLRGHQGAVSSCAYSADGQHILSSSYDKTIKVWDIQTGQEVCALSGHKNWVRACAYSSDGKYILSASYDKTLKVWDAQTGQELFTLSDHQGPASTCAYSPDGQHVLSSSYDKTLKVWDAQTGQELCKLGSHQGSVSSCTYSPDGQHILSASTDDKLKVWDAQTGQELHILSDHQGSVTSCAYSPDGKYILSTSTDKILKVWDAQTGQQLCKLSGNQGSVGSCAYGPDDQHILSASYDKTRKVWAVQTGEKIITYMHGSYGEAATVDFANNKVLYASPRAWRFLSWRFWDEEQKRHRLLPLEFFYQPE